jgi:chromosome partitioning protein
MVPVLQGKCGIQDVIQETKTPSLHLIPANTYLDQIEATAPLVTDPYAHERLRRSLQTLDYDYCFIDIPPSLGWLAQSAFYAADYSLVCSIPEPYSMLALNRLSKYHDAVNENHQLDVLGVLLSMWDERHATNQAFLEGIEGVFPGKTMKTRIRRDMAVNRSILEGAPVFDAYPTSRVADDYKDLALEFLERCESRVEVEELVGATHE